MQRSRGAAGRALAGPGRGGGRTVAGRGRGEPQWGGGRGGLAVAGPVALGTHRGGQCRSAAPLRPAGPAGERECARGRAGPVPVPGGRRAAGPVR